jgi:hypothetical protein
MSISEHFGYRNDVFQSDIFVSDIGITDVDVGCRMSDIADIEIDVDAHLWLSVRYITNVLPVKITCLNLVDGTLPP